MRAVQRPRVIGAARWSLRADVAARIRNLQLPCSSAARHEQTDRFESAKGASCWLALLGMCGTFLRHLKNGRVAAPCAALLVRLVRSNRRLSPQRTALSRPLQQRNAACSARSRLAHGAGGADRTQTHARCLCMESLLLISLALHNMFSCCARRSMSFPSALSDVRD